MTEAFIYDAIRTPRGKGKPSGALHGVKPIDLVVGLIEETRRRFPELDENRISDIILGIVSPLGDQGMTCRASRPSRPRCPTRSPACRSTDSAPPA